MLELCEYLKINVNELLSGERIMTESYDRKAEENLLNLQKEIEDRDRQLLRLEYWIGVPATAAALVMCMLASYLEMPAWLRAVTIGFAAVLLASFAFLGVRIEQKAGYYECRRCRYRYVPTYRQTVLAMHSGRTRYMKCPRCGKHSWQKKVLEAAREEN